MPLNLTLLKSKIKHSRVLWLNMTMDTTGYLHIDHVQKTLWRSNYDKWDQHNFYKDEEIGKSGIVEKLFQNKQISSHMELMKFLQLK